MIYDCPQNLLSPRKKKMCQPKSFTVWVLQVIALLGLLALCLWLSLRPKKPTYTITEFSVPVSNNGNSTSMADQGGQSGTLSYTLEIKNGNKDSSIYHENILLTFYYNQDSAGENTISGFHLGKDKTTQIMDHVDINARVWRPLLIAIANKTAEVRVDLVSSIQYRTWGRKSKHHGMNLQGRVKIGSDGKISGKKKKIKLGRASKKWSLRVT
uniref:Uncharacterized protein n=1 Tax=Davidia involucrata TaxID=16924 RepID=A0A5B7BV76_DAVIN